MHQADSTRPTFSRLAVAGAWAAALCLGLAACGGGHDDEAAEPASDDGTAAQAQAVKRPARVPAPASSKAPTAPSTAPTPAPVHTLQPGLKIPGHPHKVDVYRPAGATRAIVFLHGLGGTSGQLAYDFGFNRTKAAPTDKNVDWSWLAANGVIAVFPQGQKAPSGLSAWSNYVQDSGYDDVAFLKALSSWVKSTYGVSQVSLTGHSNGGAMTARMWCEGTTSFKAFVSLAGPMASSTYPMPGPSCTPLAAAPYYVLIGGKDTKLVKFALGNGTPSPEQKAAGLTDSILVSEWTRHEDRAFAVCGERPALQASSATAWGPTWNACTNRIRYSVVSQADHPIASLEQALRLDAADVVFGFVK